MLSVIFLPIIQKQAFNVSQKDKQYSIKTKFQNYFFFRNKLSFLSEKFVKPFKIIANTRFIRLRNQLGR